MSNDSIKVAICVINPNTGEDVIINGIDPVVITAYRNERMDQKKISDIWDSRCSFSSDIIHAMGWTLTLRKVRECTERSIGKSVIIVKITDTGDYQIEQSTFFFDCEIPQVTAEKALNNLGFFYEDLLKMYAHPDRFVDTLKGVGAGSSLYDGFKFVTLLRNIREKILTWSPETCTVLPHPTNGSIAVTPKSCIDLLIKDDNFRRSNSDALALIQKYVPDKFKRTFTEYLNSDMTSLGYEGRISYFLLKNNKTCDVQSLLKQLPTTELDNEALENFIRNNVN